MNFAGGERSYNVLKFTDVIRDKAALTNVASMSQKDISEHREQQMGDL